MSKNNSASIFWMVLNLAVGAMLAIGGIFALTDSGADSAAKAVAGVLHGGNVALTAFAVVELLSGLFIIIETFVGDKFGKFGWILKIIVIVMWAIAIISKDIVGPGLNGLVKLDNIYTLAQDLIVLCALLVTRS